MLPAMTPEASTRLFKFSLLLVLALAAMALFLIAVSDRYWINPEYGTRYDRMTGLSLHRQREGNVHGAVFLLNAVPVFLVQSVFAVASTVLVLFLCTLVIPVWRNPKL